MNWITENAGALVLWIPIITAIVAAVMRILQKTGAVQKQRADIVTESVEELGDELLSVISIMPTSKGGLSKVVSRTLKELIRKKAKAKSGSVQRALSDGAAKVDPDAAKKPRSVGRFIQDIILDVIPGR